MAKRKRTLLIDGDIVLYQQAWSHQKKFEWDEETTTIYTNEDAAREGVVSFFNNLYAELKATEMLIMVTGGDNFRKKVCSSYKSNRKTVEKPLLYPACVEALNEAFPVISEPKLEADDLMGIYATDPLLVKGEKIVCTIDKDLRQVPCILYNFTKKKKEVIRDIEADFWFYCQCLQGDPGDGYHGCPKIGKVKAEKILSSAGNTAADLWAAVVATYESKGLTEDAALETARLAYILRSGDYNFKTKKVKLWIPPEITVS